MDKIVTSGREAVLECRLRSSHLEELSLSLMDQAEEARQASQFEKARLLYKKRLSQGAGLSKGERVEAFLGLADMERIRGFFPEALRHYQQAAERFKRMDPTAFIDAQVGWALAARASGRPQAALQQLRKALVFYRKGKDPEGEAFVRWALGGTLRIAGDMKRGLGELLMALRLFKRLKSAEGLSYTCCALGGLYRMLGEYAKSGVYYREANRRMRRRKDTFGIAYSYCGLGNVERMAGRFEKALPFYRKAEKLYGKIGDRVSYAYTLWSIGTSYKMLGQYTRAHRAFYKADNLFKKTGDTRGRIYSLLGFAETEWLKNVRGDAVHGAHGRDKSRPYKTKGMTFWKQAKKIADESRYVWEKIHVRSLKNGRVNDLSSKYKKAGSKFYPTSLPVNWP
jgi:tetratricopeptide (TPR) repeat protein